MKKSVIIGTSFVLVAAVVVFLIFSSEKQIGLDNLDVVEEENLENSPEADTEENVVECNRVFNPTYGEGPHYDGPLFDAHFHMPALVDPSSIMDWHGEEGHASNSIEDPVLNKDVMLDDILCLLDKESSRGLIGFSIGSEELLDETLNSAKLIEDNASDKIYLFLMLSERFSLDTLDQIHQNNPGLFDGYGEIAFYFGDLQSQNPDDQNFLDIYGVAKKYDLIVMIHPDANQETELENAIKSNPNVKFLLHGFEIENSITGIINKYPNVYYSIDAILIRLPFQGPFLYTSNSKEEFESKFGQNYDALLNEAVNKWKPMIEQYPDRFMWGTDRGYIWHYDEEVSVLLEEFGRDFIGKLDPAVQKKFAYKNAEKILGIQ